MPRSPSRRDLRRTSSPRLPTAGGRRRWPPTRAVLYDFCTELYHTQGVSDATYARMVSEFQEIGVIDTIGIMGYYSMLAMVLNTARTPLREGQTPGLAPFPR